MAKCKKAPQVYLFGISVFKSGEDEIRLSVSARNNQLTLYWRGTLPVYECRCCVFCAQLAIWRVINV